MSLRLNIYFFIFALCSFLGAQSELDLDGVNLVKFKNQTVSDLRYRLRDLKKRIRDHKQKSGSQKQSDINLNELNALEMDYEATRSKIDSLEKLFNETANAGFFNSNQLKTAFLILVITGLTGGIGYFSVNQIRNRQIRYISYGLMLLIIVFELGVFYFSEAIALVLADAERLDKNKYPRIYDIVDELAKNAKIPTPKIWYNSMGIPNAFACGRSKNSASVLVTRGLLELLDEKELKGVLAHEISHIKNYDVTLSTAASILSTPGLIFANALKQHAKFCSDDERENRVWVGYFIGLFSELVFKLLRLSVSRSREYLADQSGAKLIADPMALASALNKIKDRMKSKYNSTSDFSSEELRFSNGFEAMCISSPFKEMSSNDIENKDEVSKFMSWVEWICEWFSTHPLTKNRIAKLKELEQLYFELIEKSK